jgi:hypothetical protein
MWKDDQGCKELILVPWKVFKFVEYGGCVRVLMSCIKKKLENKRNWYNLFFNRGKEDEAWQANEQMLIPSGIACRGFS